MNCARSHRIDVTNLHNDERVSHALLLINGYVRPRCPQYTHIRCCIAAVVEEGENPLETVVAHNGRFKFLLDLRALAERSDRSGDDDANVVTLSFTYCHSQLQVRVHVQSSASAYRVQPLYILCADETFSPVDARAACTLIDLNLQLVQCVYAETLRSAGYERTSFSLNECRVHRSAVPLAATLQRGEHELWQCYAQELLNSPTWSKAGAPHQLKFAAFIACTHYDGAAVVRSADFSYTNIRRHLRAHAALGGGGLALFGSAYFYAWPQRFEQILSCFRDATAVDLARVPDDSNFRRTHGGVYATTLGAVAHELGHTFDLGHTREGVMGNGFDLINRVFICDVPTEHLPARQLQAGDRSVAAKVTTAPLSLRFTALQAGSSSAFLDNYRAQQQRDDGFYFTRNCAVILHKHKWLRQRSTAVHRTADGIVLLQPSGVISSGDADAALAIVEVRAQDSSLVTDYYEFPDEPAVSSFTLPAQVRKQFNEKTHYIFALTTAGETKRFD